MSNYIITRQQGPIYEILLNRDEKRNAMNWDLMVELSSAFDAVERASGVRVVFIRSEGQGFSAGIDLMGFNEVAEHLGEQWRDNLFPLTQFYQSILHKAEQCSVPVFAIMHNYALGMAFELALAADFRIVAEGTKIGFPETRLGLIPDVGGTTRLTRLVGPARAKEIIMTGRHIPLHDAERWGLVHYVVPQEHLLAKAQELAEEIIASAPLAVNYAKRVINDIVDHDSGYRIEAWAQAQLIRTEDFMNGAQAALFKQPAEWKGK